MAKKKTPRTIVPIADRSASGKNKRLPKKPMDGGNWMPSASKYHY